MSSCDKSLVSTITDSMDTFAGDIKFGVCRKTLEKMLRGDSSLPSALDFFMDVSTKTGAIIKYPRLEMLEMTGKKEPEIRVIGNPIEIFSARNLIMESLDPIMNRVVLKLDVSHTDHSHIIGKGGKRIQSIRDSTKCHIHLPDGNRTDYMEKSNQVTIVGTSLNEAVEARLLVRQSLPLTVSFELPMSALTIELLNSHNPRVQYYQNRYSLMMSFHMSDHMSNKITVIVRGTRIRFDDIKDMIHCLHQDLNMSSIGVNETIVSINIEIASQHHSYVMGKGNCNVRAIQDHTGAVVLFPDFAPTQTSTVTIRSKGIDSAFMAWLELLGYLPIVLILDLRSNQIDDNVLTSLMANQLLSIRFKPKLRSDVTSVVIKTQERHINLFFEVRNRIQNVSKHSPHLWTHLASISDCSTSSPQPKGYPKYPFHLEPELIRGFNDILQ